MSIAAKLTTIAENEQKVYEAGQKSEYDRFWDAYQENGNRASGSYMFAQWKEENIRPKYDVAPTTSAEGMFYYSTISGDVEEFFAKQGRVLDLTRLNGFLCVAKLFRGCLRTTKVGVINASTANQLTETFYGCDSLESIEKLIVTEALTTNVTNAFTGCINLRHIEIEGTIARSFNISACSSLSVESAESIILALKDYSGTSDANKYTVTFHNDVLELIELEMHSGAYLLDIIVDKGWNF